MKTSFVLALLLLASCASPRKSATPVRTPVAPPVEIVAPKPKKVETPKKKVKERSQVQFDVMGSSRVVLHLLNLDSRNDRDLDLEQKERVFVIEKGHWQIMAFTLEGKTYEADLSGRSFVFKTRDRRVSYGGLLIFECPKVSDSYFPVLREMKYFNRYHFTKNKEECEMVVGNDFAKASAAWNRTAGKGKGKSLILGF